MTIENKIHKTLENTFFENKYNIQGLSISNEKNGKRVENRCIKFKVSKKKNMADLSEDELIPERVIIEGEEFITDVEEEPEPPKMLACYSSSDSEILRLRGDPSLLTPLKGGQEIIKYPSGWTDQGGGSYSFSLGTLGFFAIDNTDNRVVGVTNAHVACEKKLIASDRNENINDTYNTIEQTQWVFDGSFYEPGALSLSGNNLITTVNNIKRYSPFLLSGPNYTDIALLMMNPTHLDNNSYRVHHPTTEVEYTTHMPFATTTELDDLLTSNPRIYSVGRTTGPKGWIESPSCRLRITGVGVNINVLDPEVDPNTIPFNDVIEFRYEDGSDYPINSGDSGSMVFADFSGVKKIIGVAFAGGTTTGYLCRIDRISAEFNISAWDNTHTLNESTPLTPTVTKFPITDTNSSQKEIQVNGDTYYQVGTSSTP